MHQTSERNNQIAPVHNYDNAQKNFIDIIYTIYKKRNFLIIFCLTITLIVGITSVFSEKVYEVKSVILPEINEEGGGIGMKSALLEQFGISGIGGSHSTPSGLLKTILKSSELSLEALKRYDYFFINGIGKGMVKKKARLYAEKIRASESKDDSSFSIFMQFNDPILAVELTNTYVEALDKYNRTNSFTSAKRLREYIENRLRVAEEELDEYQKQLREFQEKNKAVSISKQTESTLEVLAEMESQKVALEIEKAQREKFYKGPHIEIEQLNAQIEAMNKNIDRLTYSEDSNIPIERRKGKVEFYIPLTRIPSLNYNESKLLLKVKAKTAVITMLTTQFEQAKLDEAKNMPTINILERAVPPEGPLKPRKKLNILIGFAASLFIGVFIIFLIEFKERMDSDPEFGPKWREMKQWIKRKLFFR